MNISAPSGATNGNAQSIHLPTGGGASTKAPSIPPFRPSRSRARTTFTSFQSSRRKANAVGNAQPVEGAQPAGPRPTPSPRLWTFILRTYFRPPTTLNGRESAMAIRQT